MTRYILGFVFMLSLLIIAACASIGSLPGGEKDEQPPKILWDISTPNLQTNFKKERIELYFDEWIKLNNPAQAIVISPPLEFKPDISQIGKRVLIKFNEEEILKPDVTTIINFGDAIQDYTEGNPVENLQFVFSTGDAIDSLTCRGIVTDILGQPMEGIWVGLYENLQDSAIYKEKPLYLNKTDSSGVFNLQYLAQGTYRIFALKDENFNLKYEENEWLGFLDNTIEVPSSEMIVIKASQKPQKPEFKSQLQTYEGIQKFYFPQTQRGTNWRILSDSIEIYSQRFKDTLMIFHPGVDSFALELEKPIIDFKDTITVKNGRRLQSDSLFQLTLTKKDRMVIGDDIQITTNFPVEGYDTAHIQLRDTAVLDLKNYQFELDSTGFELKISGDFDSKTRYTLDFYPGAFVPIQAVKPIDTTSFNIGFVGKKNLGILELTLKNVKEGIVYGLIIKTEKEEILRRRFEASQVNFVFEDLSPANYELVIFEDLNKNGIADAGDYLRKRQPEQIFSKKLSSLRANWTLEVEFDLNNNE